MFSIMGSSGEFLVGSSRGLNVLSGISKISDESPDIYIMQRS